MRALVAGVYFFMNMKRRFKESAQWTSSGCPGDNITSFYFLQRRSSLPGHPAALTKEQFHHSFSYDSLYFAKISSSNAFWHAFFLMGMHSLWKTRMQDCNAEPTTASVVHFVRMTVNVMDVYEELYITPKWYPILVRLSSSTAPFSRNTVWGIFTEILYCILCWMFSALVYCALIVASWLFHTQCNKYKEREREKINY